MVGKKTGEIIVLCVFILCFLCGYSPPFAAGVVGDGAGDRRQERRRGRVG